MDNTSFVPVRRALISVSDKSGLVPFAAMLKERGVQIVSTGHTAEHLTLNGISVIDVETYTGFPEMLDGRLKTLHPLIHGGLLYDRSDLRHVERTKRHRIKPIDLLIVNFYPFAEIIARQGTRFEQALESIDIGGPAMIRAAAKNHLYVAVITDPAQYGSMAEELEQMGGTTYKRRFHLAREAFFRSAEYERAIADYLARRYEEA